ncbi:helix-turn-helix transcriptional regulator [Tenacibaculum sp. 190524A02b]|uniref:helix-turn-helix transcriptional regulator n=1 Tax=Tenacibaculum vairaonense TaxID=3137860 RepID=UPI0032B144F1
MHEKSFKQLANSFYKFENDSIKALLIAKTYLKKAKAINDSLKTADAFYFLSSIYKKNGDLFLNFNDSIIFFGKNLNTKFYPIIGYFNKGDFYYKKRLFYKALENYLLADKHSYNNDFRYDIKHRLGLLKSRYGKNNEALFLFKEVYKYHLKKQYHKTDINYHLPILFALSDSYLKNQKIDSALQFCTLGYKKSTHVNDTLYQSYFKLQKGVINFKLKDYKSSIHNIKTAIPNISKAKDLANLSYAHFFLGKALNEINKEHNALISFTKVDSLYKITKDIHPDLRESYELIINHYKNNNNQEKELIYIRKLLEVDKRLNNNYRSITNFFEKEYDTPKLLSEQNKIVKSLKTKIKIKKQIAYGSLAIVFLTLIVSFYHFKKRKLYKKRFEEALKKHHDSKKTKTKPISKKEINIPKDIVADILGKLDTFEKRKSFLRKNITLATLAKEFNTNTSYLSKVINYNKNTSFSNYLNRLRIEHVAEELKTNSSLRKYTVKAIAEEVGFSNSESFSKAFYTLKGIKPSYYVKELNKKSV